MGQHMVSVHHEGRIVGKVAYNSDLDHWDGHNFTCGSTGRHLGITRLKKTIDGMSFVLIHGTQWDGETDHAELVSNDEAKQAILSSGDDNIFKKYFPNDSVVLEEG